MINTFNTIPYFGLTFNKYFRLILKIISNIDLKKFLKKIQCNQTSDQMRWQSFIDKLKTYDNHMKTLETERHPLIKVETRFVGND